MFTFGWLWNSIVVVSPSDTVPVPVVPAVKVDVFTLTTPTTVKPAWLVSVTVYWPSVMPARTIVPNGWPF